MILEMYSIRNLNCVPGLITKSISVLNLRILILTCKKNYWNSFLYIKKVVHYAREKAKTTIQTLQSNFIVKTAQWNFRKRWNCLSSSKKHAKCMYFVKRRYWITATYWCRYSYWKLNHRGWGAFGVTLGCSWVTVGFRFGCNEELAIA